MKEGPACPKALAFHIADGGEMKPPPIMLCSHQSLCIIRVESVLVSAPGSIAISLQEATAAQEMALATSRPKMVMCTKCNQYISIGSFM
uniref:Uncharacterized protein n=1 Tax=Arundo donax TaxID=35708 RepID=A0A0A9B5Q2_ARUDO